MLGFLPFIRFRLVSLVTNRGVTHVAAIFAVFVLVFFPASSGTLSSCIVTFFISNYYSDTSSVDKMCVMFAGLLLSAIYV